MDLDDDFEIMSISPDEHHNWSRISQISRHPTNGGLVRITTINGRSTTATLSHSFLTRNDSFGVIPIKGAELSIGTIVPVLVGDSCQWEAITELEFIEGNPDEFVYDFTVPGNESFLVDNGIFVHNTLNTFHTAGSASKAQLTTGVPRFKELLSISQSIKSPQVTVVLQDEYAYDKERAKSVLNHITITTIRDLTLSTEIYFDRDSIKGIKSCNSEDDKFLNLYRVFSDLYSIPSDSERNPWVLRIRLDKRKMMDKGIQMLDINHAITSKLNIDKEDISCMFSDDNAGDLVLRIQCINPVDEADDCDEEDKICVLKALEKTILNEIVLRGVKGIHSGSMYPETQNYKYNPLTNNFEQKTHWIVKTNGTNLEDILVQQGVDPYRSVSNDIVEVYNLLGIEAARNVLIKEIHEVLSDSYVNSRHIVLLADVMTNRGTLMSIDRHGINKSDRGPLAKCSFEETPDVIARAAIFGELDKLNGVSANIMVGQEVPIGTGSVDVLFDEEMYREYISKEEEEITEEEAAELTEEGKFAEEYCKPSNFTDF
jgi:DNA-directed RNA polymerase II subunit RPB1